MSQPRMRKLVSSGDDGARAHTSVAKASGDSVVSAMRPNQENLRSRSKNKIPKSLRYDLENALVSLCDVWFEEIKPHLVRNNIKLHVHGSSAGGDHERQQPPARLAPPSCSHLDPGAASDHPLPPDASSAGCCSTPQTVSRVPCARLRTPSHPCLLSPLPSLPQTPRDCIQTPSHNCEEKHLKRPRTRRKKRRPKPQPQSNWRVPRLCRTYSVLSSAATGSRMRRIDSNLLLGPQPPRDEYYQFIVRSRKTAMKNKSTQTDEAMSGPSVSVGCQKGEPRPSLCSSQVMRRVAWRLPAVRSPTTTSPVARSPGMTSPAAPSPRTVRPAALSSRTTSPAAVIPRTASPATLSPRTISSAALSPRTISPPGHNSRMASPDGRSPGSISPDASSPESRSLGALGPAAHCPESHISNALSCRPSSSTCTSSALAMTRQTDPYRCKRLELRDVDALPLFQDDLIDIIERNDKRLRLLYSSPEKDDFPLFMSLYPLSNVKQKKPGGLKKNPPWR